MTSKWMREEEILELKSKIVEDAFYEHDGDDYRIVLIVDGRRHIVEAVSSGYGGECSVTFEKEEVQ